MKMKILVHRDADFGAHGGYQCEWAYNPRKAELLLGFQQYASLGYTIIQFKEVHGYKFSNWMYVDVAENRKPAEMAFLYEVEPEDAKPRTYNHYLTFQTPRGSLQIFAGSYEILPYRP